MSAQEAEAHRSFYRTTAHDPRLAEHTSRSPYQQQWTTALHPAMTPAQSQTSPHVFSTPAPYVSWPSPNPNAFARGQFAPPVVPSSPYSSEQNWPSVPWPTLHPDDVEVSSDSRSTSPNPADLHNFGFPLPDGRSWRCAYPNCTSQARFTRGCDLRKHYRRHTKPFFCRHEECPQSSEGGFSSRKDRDRHESKVPPFPCVALSVSLTSCIKHKPGVPCTHDECERIFSRVDNMKDHVRRIHRKPS